MRHTTESQPSTAVVEHYRLDQHRDILRALAVGTAVLASAMVVGLALSRGLVPEALRPLALLGGAALTVAGPGWAVLGLYRALSTDVYVVLRTDGVLHRRGATARFVRWEDLSDARAGDAGVVLVLADGTEAELPERFHGTDTAGLARRIRAVRNKALFGLL